MKLTISNSISDKLKFILYIIVLIMINLVSNTLFFRIDLTSNKKYSLSDASKTTVSLIKEPLNVKVFFSENLSGQYANLPREVRDLMEEYTLTGNKNFNYQIYTIKQDGSSVDEKGRNLKDLAADYSIFPIQIQTIENDEVKLQNVYMGISLVHGNMMETIPSLGTVRNLEYQITGSINKVSRQISALLSLKENISVELYLSGSLYSMGEGISEYPDEVKKIVEELNKTSYNRLDYKYIDPDSSPVQDKFNLTSFNFQNTDGSLKKIYADILIKSSDNFTTITLLQKNIFGYDIIGRDELNSTIGESVEKVLNLNTGIAYLSNYGTIPLYQNPYDQQSRSPSLNNLNMMISDNYSIRPLANLDNGIPDNLKTLIIAGPREQFTQWDLYQIDQYIMKGNSVAFFLDSYSEVFDPNQNPYNPQPPNYIPRNTGLDELLKYYGVEISKSYVLDENSYKQIGKDASGGLTETKFYFAPEIQSENINRELPFLNNIKGLVLLNTSPLIVDQDKDIDVLFSSSDKSWEMKDNINLYNPSIILPPGDDEKQKFPLAAIVGGEISSYFQGKELPKPELKEGTGIISSESISGNEVFIPSTKTGKIFVIGTSTVLTDNLLDQTGTSPNSVYIYNILDTLNGRDDFAEMRSKNKLYNPIRQTSPGERSFIKGVNIVALPLLTIFAGLISWFLWSSRKKKIEQLFERKGSK
ncbi:MAG: Gldg family protein [Spirochaetales bacterium]|nr:Gldg family protein [Spirochaetales bacterium]